MTPILLLFFGVAPAAAVGTDLWFAAITKLVATRVHHGRDLIDWQVVKRLWMGSLPASALTMVVLRVSHLSTHGGPFLREAIAGAVLLSAVGLLVQRPLLRAGKRMGMERGMRLQAPLTVAAGAFLGFLVTLTSVGAGAFGVVILVFLYPERLTPSRLVATDIAHAIPLVIFAGSAHLVMGNVDWRLLGSLLCGSIPGVLLGAWLSSRLPQGVLRWILAIVLLGTGFRLWI